jgi:hypothetical protein
MGAGAAMVSADWVSLASLWEAPTMIFSPTTNGITDKILGMDENQADFELVPTANGTGTATAQEEPSTLLCMPYIWQLISNTCQHGVLLSAFQHKLFPINFLCTSQSSAVYCRWANSTGLPDVMLNGVKRVSLEDYVEDTSPQTTLQLLHHYHDLHED